MLWKKESDAKDALFIDLCKSPASDPMKMHREFQKLEAADQNDMDDINFVVKKDNDLAFHFRTEGNIAFAERKLNIAIERFNKSLCVAKTGSEHIAQAYGNRAMCYILLGFLDNYHVDVELAKKANLDQQSIEKMKLQKKRYEKVIAQGGVSWAAANKVAKLSFPPNKRFPSLANILRIESNGKDGRYVKTTKDINVGQTIMHENCYVGETYTIKYESCAACLRSNTNLVPCTECTSTMLCHDGCENSDFHRIECKIRKYPVFGNDVTAVRRMPVLRSVWMALKLFSNVDELMDFVQAAVTSDPFEIPSLADKTAAYRSFLKIHHNTKTIPDAAFVYWSYKHLLDQPEIAAKFCTEKHKRFLMHLIAQHLAIITLNSNLDEVILMLDEKPIRLTTSSYLLGITNTYFNHSCAPNVFFYIDNGHLIGKTVRPIKKGEHLMVCYDSISSNTKDRRIRMKNHSGYDFWCECKRCNDNDSDDRSIKCLTLDDDYQFARKHIKGILDFKCVQQRDETRKHCERFLQKYGATALWNKEVEFMMLAYIRSFKQWTTTVFSKFRETKSHRPILLKCQPGIFSEEKLRCFSDGRERQEDLDLD